MKVWALIGESTQCFSDKQPTQHHIEMVSERPDGGVYVAQPDGTWGIAAPAVPDSVTMRQARLALLQSGLLATVESEIALGTDEAMKIEWEYATEVKRDWPSLNNLAISLNISEAELDNLFILATTL